MTTQQFLLLVPLFGALAVLFAFVKAVQIRKKDPGTGAMTTIAQYIEEGAMAFLRQAINKPMRIHAVDRVPPLSFAMYATKIKEALLVEDPRETMERLFHIWWSRLQTPS